MILDVLDNAHAYEGLNPRFKAAFAFLRRADLAELPEGRNEVDAEDIYAMVAIGPGRTPEEGLLETHDHYIDIQYVISGEDSIGWKARTNLGPATERSDPRTDVDFYEDEPVAWTTVKPGMFGIYFPEDAHMPMISSGHLHKVIVKVKA